MTFTGSPSSFPASASIDTLALSSMGTRKTPASSTGIVGTLGVLGGGQLGRMLVQAAQRMGLNTVVLDDAMHGPAGQVAGHTIVAHYNDKNGWEKLRKAASAITTEFENVPSAALQWLAQYGPVSPPADAVAIAQDRAREKRHFTSCDVPCAPYATILSAADIAALDRSLFPAILKTARMGYDGKGQSLIIRKEDVLPAWQAMNKVPCVLEKRLDLALECSVIIARNAQGQCVHFAPQRNVHHDGILATTYAFEGAVPAALSDQLVQATRRIAQGLRYVGVLCVEYFVLQDGSWVVNEIAPRPHNSGHYTIDACNHSQFDLQVRTTMQLPLAQPQQHSAAIMLNLLGDAWFDANGRQRTPDWNSILSISSVHLHLYGKAEVRTGRKMGHITITASSPTAAQSTAAEVAQILGLPFEALPL